MDGILCVSEWAHSVVSVQLGPGEKLSEVYPMHSIVVITSVPPVARSLTAAGTKLYRTCFQKKKSSTEPS